MIVESDCEDWRMRLDGWPAHFDAQVVCMGVENNFSAVRIMFGEQEGEWNKVGLVQCTLKVVETCLLSIDVCC